MPWTTPKTWSHLELVTSDNLNTHLKGNLDYLKGNDIPRMTTTERDALTPSAGDTIFNTTANVFQVYSGSSWTDIGGSSPIVNWMMFR